MLLFLIFLFSIGTTKCARILAVFPTPSISHQVVFRPLTQELAKRGHEVTIITPDPAFLKGQTPKNIKEIDMHDISYSVWNELKKKARDKDLYLMTQYKVLGQLFLNVFSAQLKTAEFQEILSLDKKYFDLLLIEACVTPTLALSHVFDAPVIQVSSLGSLLNDRHALGIPLHPFLYPTATRKRLYNLSIMEKLGALFEISVTEYIVASIRRKENEMLREHFGPDFPTLEILTNNIDMLLLNTNHIWSGNYPVPPNVVFMGGIHQNPIKELPTDLKSWLDSSKNGVIYVSFGSNWNSERFSQKSKRVFTNVFSNLPYDVLLKWDNETEFNEHKNIRSFKWLPQADVLRHPKVKLFITQAGLQSTDEAISAGIPMIGIPFVVDQSFNAEKYEHFNIGIKLDITTITENNLRESIDTVIGNEKYRKNIAKLRMLINDQPVSPLQNAVWWTEYVIRHGGASHLRSPAANISWLEYFEIELLAVIMSILLSLVSGAYPRRVYRPTAGIQEPFDPTTLGCTDQYYCLLGTSPKMCHSLQLETGKQQGQSVKPTTDCKPNSRRLFVLDKSSKQRFLIDTGSDICCFTPKYTQGRPQLSTLHLSAANGTSIKTWNHTSNTKLRVVSQLPLELCDFLSHSWTALLDFPPPNTNQSMRRFLGTVNYCRRFFPAAAQHQAPLIDAVTAIQGKSAKPFTWTPQLLEHFEACKNSLTTATTLAQPNPSAPLCLFTDASSSHIGACLQQKTTSNTWHLLAFYSKKLTNKQNSLPAYYRELLAVYESVQHFRHIMKVQHTTIYTDHKPLLYAFVQKREKLSPVQLNQLIFVSQFTTDIVYNKGTDNVVADALSPWKRTILHSHKRRKWMMNFAAYVQLQKTAIEAGVVLVRYL
ncbi:UDP-glycosyltransferase UGT5-like [Battus philenor]|uniref:UDP-glycosyltransferase UGT5-like n=1 Tax=Battus philenor TaxID=42288 RepID=UPI0035D1239B